ncbi:DUF4190 domain-containing protein [Streptomyces sp. NPDC002394]
MSDNRDQQPGGYDPTDPWAPPNRDGVELSKPATPSPSPVHDQPTMTSFPSAPGAPGAPEAVPPPPVAPGGPAATAGYGYPTAAPGYGYPPASPTPPGAPGYGAYPSSYGPGYGQPPGWQPPQQPSNGMGIASLVLGIIAAVGFCLYGLNIILGILALVFGVIGMKKAGRGEATNRGMALAGVILGAVGIVVGSVVLGLIIWAATQDASSFEEGSGDPFASVLQIERGAS